MDKDSVTRAFSIGAISGRTEASDDFLLTRRHSSAGTRALLWATSSAKSFGCSTDSQASHESIFPNILTPNSIPQFTIPSLSVQTGAGLWNKETEENDAESNGGVRNPGTESPSSASSSASSSRLNLALSDRRAERSVSDPLAKGKPFLHRDLHRFCSYKEDHQCLDPASKAALSLPHLAKVTTPYGFVTLSQSPQMASEEALLHQAGLRRFKKDNQASFCPNNPQRLNTEEGKGKSFHLSGAKKKLTRDSVDSQSKGRVVQTELDTSSAPCSTPSISASLSSTPKPSDTKLKRRFYGVIRKYFVPHHLN